MSLLSQPHFHNEAAAFEKLESIVWPNGPVCPKCGHTGKVYDLKGVRTKPSKKNPEGVERHGLKKCGACRKQFTVRVGTVFEASHIPLHKWFQAVHLMCCSKKGISAHQLHRILQIKYQSAWFMAHRIREAMRTGDLAPPQMGGNGTYVEVDETFIGETDAAKRFRRIRGFKRGGLYAKRAILTLVERGGEARSFHIDFTDRRTIMPIVKQNIDKETKIATDQATHYNHMSKHFLDHGSVNHSIEEWRRGDIHTNTVEGYFSIFKRGMKGVYQHCSEKHLHRYLAEFDFRYNNRTKLGVDDSMRTELAMRGVIGKRLKYQGPDSEGVTP